MKNNAIFTIFKKEVTRFFKDRRTLIALIMPGILLYIVYSIMGSAITSSFVPDEDYVPSALVENMPAELSAAFNEMFEVGHADGKTIDECKQAVIDEEYDIFIIFPENFYKDMLDYEPIPGAVAPNISVYYNSASTNSSIGYQNFVGVMTALESQLANKFDINMGGDSYDVANESDLTGMIFSSMLPMLLVVFLFSGCMAVAPESIAGEKERGTIATMLITPTKRSHIAIGKILALSLMALISGASSTIGAMLSIPKLMGGTVNIDGSAYGITDYAMLALVILSTVLLLITLISIISAYAKNVKEAGSWSSPLMIISMIISLSGMMGVNAENPALYLIPIFNSVQSMIGIFSYEPNVLNMVITVAANFTFTAIGIFVLTKMFNSEKIMFNK